MRLLKEKHFSPKSLRIAKKIEARLVAQYAQTQIESQVNVGDSRKLADWWDANLSCCKHPTDAVLSRSSTVLD
jgi:hypothetical protein